MHPPLLPNNKRTCKSATLWPLSVSISQSQISIIKMKEKYNFDWKSDWDNMDNINYIVKMKINCSITIDYNALVLPKDMNVLKFEYYKKLFSPFFWQINSGRRGNEIWTTTMDYLSTTKNIIIVELLSYIPNTTRVLKRKDKSKNQITKSFESYFNVPKVLWFNSTSLLITHLL